MSGPVYIRLSRRAGFNLQAVSRKFNGRDAVKCTRPGRWGNPFSVLPNMKPGTVVGGAYGYIAVPTAEDAVACYEEMLRQNPEIAAEARRMLAGKNLACWCKQGRPCHVRDVLLKIANAGDNSGDISGGRYECTAVAS